MEKRIISALALVCVGLFVPYWPLALLGVLLLVLSGRWFLATLCALLLDVAYGQPIGIFHIVVLPFTLLVLCLLLLRMVIVPYLRPGSPKQL